MKNLLSLENDGSDFSLYRFPRSIKITPEVIGKFWMDEGPYLAAQGLPFCRC